MRALLVALVLAVGLPAEAQDDARRPPLFVVEGADSRVYLLGSVHVLPAGALPLPPRVEAAYAAASVVAFELDLDAATAGAATMLAAATDEVAVTEALTPAQLATVDAAFGALGVPAGALHGFEPWFVGMSYGLAVVQHAGLAGEAGGVDAHLYERAGADAKERVAFETLELQTAAFDDLPVESQTAFLLDAVAAGPDDAAAQFETLVEAWAAGDDDRLAALLHDGLSHPGLFEALLVARNRAWVPQIEALLAREGETALVVVGAGHLVGPGSVVDMLREAGRTVTRL